MKRLYQEDIADSGAQHKRLKCESEEPLSLSTIGKDAIASICSFLEPIELGFLHCVSVEIHLQLCELFPVTALRAIHSDSDARVVLSSKRLFEYLFFVGLPEMLVKQIIRLPVRELILAVKKDDRSRNYPLPQSFRYEPVRGATLRSLSIHKECEEAFRLPPLPSSLVELGCHGSIRWRISDLPKGLKKLHTNCLPVDLSASSFPAIADLELDGPSSEEVGPSRVTDYLGIFAEKLVRLDIRDLHPDIFAVLADSYRRIEFPVIQELVQPAELPLPRVPSRMKALHISVTEHEEGSRLVLPDIGDNKEMVIEYLSITTCEELKVSLSPLVVVSTLSIECDTVCCFYEEILARVERVSFGCLGPDLKVVEKSRFVATFEMELCDIGRLSAKMSIEKKDAYHLFRFNALAISLCEASEARHYQPTALDISIEERPDDPEEELSPCFSTSTICIVSPMLEDLTYLMRLFPGVSKMHIRCSRRNRAVSSFKGLFPSVDVKTDFF